MATKTKDDSDQQSENGPGFWHNMRGQWGHHGFSRAQFGQRGWLRPAVLKLLSEKPMNGMEMINQFYEASHGWWKPSPGSVYPLLEMLETEGLIKKRADGRYDVTEMFAKESGPKGQVDEMLTNMEGTVTYLEEMAKSEKSKFSAYKKRIEKISGRLSDL